MKKSSVQLRFHDMDMLGHMYNGQHTHIFDIGKLEFLRDVVGIRWDAGLGVVNVSTTNTYFQQVKFGDEVEIETTAEKIGTKSFTILHRLIDLCTRQVKAESRVTLVGFDFRNQHSIELLPEWREKLLREIEKDSDVVTI